MDWTPGGMSGDIEDRRADSGGGGGGFGGGGGLGILGFLVLLVISFVTGRNYLGSFFHGGGQPAVMQRQERPNMTPQQENRDVQLISWTLDDVQKTWTKIFAEDGKTYHHAKLVLFRGETYSGCGTAEAATGPFYCPADQKVYIDLNFWDELRKFGRDPRRHHQ